MAILIFNRFPKDKIDYESWFADLDDELFMFGPVGALADFHGFTVRQPFAAAFARDGRVEWEALALFHERPYRALIALEESEIIRAARLRERLGLPGQHAHSALAFRDKLVMKEVAHVAGIPVAPFAALEHPLDLFDFVAAHGLPVVVKPRLGMSSRDTTVLRTTDAVKTWLTGADCQGKMVEGYVEGPLFHTDGIVVDGHLAFMCAFAYLDTCLAYTEGRGVGDLLLSPSHPLHGPLAAFTQHVLAALPTPPTATFHLEAFQRAADGRFVLCEVASRTAAGLVPPQIELAYGVAMDRYCARAQCGKVDPLPPLNAPPATCTASYFVPPRCGILRRQPDSLPFPWCVRYDRTGKLGEAYAGPQRSTHNYAVLLVTGSTETEAGDRIKQAVRWVEEHTEWDELPAPPLAG